MRETTGNLFDTPACALVIPINWRVRNDGEAVMGAGVAWAAARRWAWLPAHLGMRIRAGSGPHVVATYTADGPALVLYPTKGDWRQAASMPLITGNLAALVGLADSKGWRTIALPRLGCGHGGLDWATQVQPLLAGALDDRFVVVHPGGTVHPDAVGY